MTNAEWIANMRAVLDWYEAHPNLPTPSPELAINSCDTKEEAAAIMRECLPCKKTYYDNIFTIYKTISGIELRFVFWRDQVCTRRVVRVEEVPEQIIPEQVIPASKKEIVEWDCEPILQEKENAA